MKVITSVKNFKERLFPGDVFIIRVNQGSSEEIEIKDKIYNQKDVQYIATYRYAESNGGVSIAIPPLVSYGDHSDYSLFISDSVFLSDLSREQQVEFLRTSNIQVEKTNAGFDVLEPSPNRRPLLIVQIINRLLLMINEWAKK